MFGRVDGCPVCGKGVLQQVVPLGLEVYTASDSSRFPIAATDFVYGASWFLK